MLAEDANVAQFVSFDPEPTQRFSRVFGYDRNHRFGSLSEALETLLRTSVEQSINIRSFDPYFPKSRDFLYGIKSLEEAVNGVQNLAARGLHTIANETIDVCDGGVSGVVLGEAIEFAPCDTPRCVEKEGCASLPRSLGLELMRVVYGFAPALAYAPEERVEFSIHPIRRGVRREHTIIWEVERVDDPTTKGTVRWPNRFSEFIGDKAFGLLIAHLLGLPVPFTIVISRSIAPFSFGTRTDTSETWLRTCPRTQVPGKYTTRRGWTDPFQLMSAEDPAGTHIASVLAQDGVDAVFSGALISSVGPDGQEDITIEGVRGFGDQFMVGAQAPTLVPAGVVRSVRRLYRVARRKLGPVRMEWAADSSCTWIVQFHRGAVPSTGRTIFPGEVTRYRRFDTNEGLEALRSLIDKVSIAGEGIILVGDVGITSHFGDVLRRARVPSMIER